jgi:hypothetical protein
MTLEEAIKEYEFSIKYHHGHGSIRIPIQTAQLGLEALKDLREFRIEFPNMPLLPSEAKD